MKHDRRLWEIHSFISLKSSIVYCTPLLLSLLIMRMITLIFPHQVEIMSLRLILGFGIIFNFIVPILFVYTHFGRMDFWLSMIIPFASYAILYPVFDSILLGTVALLCDTTFIVPLIIGGLGIAFIGCGSYFLRLDRVLSRTCFVCGILILILSAPNVVPVSYFILSGDGTILRLIPNFL